jgi:hypothetical protein
MLYIRFCPECGVPEPITTDRIWLGSGAIVLRNDPSRRLGFIESENLDPVYFGVSEIIGSPIERLVTDVVHRSTAQFIKDITPPEVRKAARAGQLDWKSLADAYFFNSQILGFGANEIVDFKPGVSMAIQITEPFSVLLIPGMVSG